MVKEKMYNSNIVMEWRRIRKGNYIMGSKCKRCSALFYPARTKCTKCGNDETENIKFKGHGRVYAYSTIFSAPMGFEKQVPYTVGIVKLDEGPKMTAQIIDFEDIKVGMNVEACIRKVYVDGDAGIIHYGIKFRPAE